MAGTIKGGFKAAATNRERYGKDFYKRIGTSGGAVSKGGGFSKYPELAKSAGIKGGSVTLEQRHGRYAKKG